MGSKYDRNDLREKCLLKEIEKQDVSTNCADLDIGIIEESKKDEMTKEELRAYLKTQNIIL